MDLPFQFLRQHRVSPDLRVVNPIPCSGDLIVVEFPLEQHLELEVILVLEHHRLVSRGG